MPSGRNARYGKSVPSITRVSHSLNAIAVAWLPIRPDWPTSYGLSSSKPSFALSVTTIGAVNRSARASTSVRAWRAPCPTSSVTGPPALIASAAARSDSSEGAGAGTASTNRGTAVCFGRSRPPTSPGRVRTATPCSWRAALTACSISDGIWSTLVTVWQNTDTSANSASLSTSWKKSLPMSSRGTWPVIASTGVWLFFASYRPLSRWMAPGPTVPMQTPSRPVSCAWALAANAPASSWRTPTHSTRSSRRIASVTGFSASPTTPHTWVTPWSASAVIRRSATVVLTVVPLRR